MDDHDTPTATIRTQNDLFRAAKLSGRHTDLAGRVYLTQGIAALPEPEQHAILRTVADFEDFTEDNDPHGEHDFGAFHHAGEKIFWKIDYYDERLKYGSEDPADPAQTTRVLTIMLASEY